MPTDPIYTVAMLCFLIAWIASVLIIGAADYLSNYNDRLYTKKFKRRNGL